MGRFIRFAVLVILVLALAGCLGSSREERLAKIRGKHGQDAGGGDRPVAVALSPGAQLYRAKACHTCHGDDGIKTLLPNYPIIARQGQEYALRQMKDIQNGSRSNGFSAAMKALIQDLTEADMVLLADYMANELGGDTPIGTGVVDPESPGAQLFKSRTCTACHGADGMTPILPDYPRIAGHNPEYALQQMRDVKSGARANSMAVLGMQGVMHLVNDEEMAQLADYISTLPR